MFNETDIICALPAELYEKKYGKYSTNRLGLHKYPALSFSDGLQKPPLRVDDNGELEISGKALLQVTVSLADLRPEREFTLPDDLHRVFEAHTASHSRAAAWCGNVLPVLATTTGIDRLNVGQSVRYSAGQERAQRGDVWAALAAKNRRAGQLPQ